jgi:hypothetical protein
MSEEQKISDREQKRPPGSAQQPAESGGGVDGSMLSINDIYSACQIIDAATRRGAFGANEAKAIGELYDKLISFLRNAAPHLFEEEQKQEESSNV